MEGKKKKGGEENGKNLSPFSVLMIAHKSLSCILYFRSVYSNDI